MLLFLYVSVTEYYLSWEKSVWYRHINAVAFYCDMNMHSLFLHSPTDGHLVFFPGLHYCRQYCPAFICVSKCTHRSSLSCIPKNGIAGSCWIGVVTFIFHRVLTVLHIGHLCSYSLRSFLVWKIHEVGSCLICHPPQPWMWMPVHNWAQQICKEWVILLLNWTAHYLRIGAEFFSDSFYFLVQDLTQSRRLRNDKGKPVPLYRVLYGLFDSQIFPRL